MESDQRQIIDADYRVTETGEVERAPARRGSRGGIVGTLIAALVFLATKLKFVLGALKGVKFLGTGLSAIVSVGAYALAFGWQFAVGLVVLLFIHEMGHVLALRHYGVKATAPIFIPFMGAFIGMKQLPRNAVMEAVVGIGGPMLGSLGALATYGLYLLDGHPIFLALTYLGILLNLFNLLPILPLDGGRIVGALSRWFWLVGFAGLLGLLIVWPSPILILILLFGAPEVWSRVRNRGAVESEEYYEVSASERIAVGVAYFGLIFLLGIGFYELGPMITSNRP